MNRWMTGQRKVILNGIWATWHRAIRQHDHPLRTPVLGTCSRLGTRAHSNAELRTVVLREVNKKDRTLVLHTDLRSGKCLDLRRNPYLKWLFYDPEEKIQIRAWARGRIDHGNALARKAWSNTPLASRVNYGTVAPPGTPISTPGAAWPRAAKPSNLTVSASEPGFENFAVLTTKVSQIEFLKLDIEGHRRVEFRWSHGKWASTWLVP